MKLKLVLFIMLAGSMVFASPSHAKGTEISETVWNPCLNEQVELTGFLNEKDVWKDNKDGSVDLKFHVNYHYQGQGVVTGTRYVLNGNETFHHRHSPDWQNETYLSIYGENLITKGPEENLRLKVNSVFVVRDGQVRADHSSIWFECQ